MRVECAIEEETFPLNVWKSRPLGLRGLNDSYFRTRVLFFSSVSTNCTGISTDLSKEEANAYPDVHRLAVQVHEHLLSPTNLLTQGIVDRVTGAPPWMPLTLAPLDGVACLLPRRALLYLLSRWPGGGVSGRAEADGIPRPLRLLLLRS